MRFAVNGGRGDLLRQLIQALMTPPVASSILNHCVDQFFHPKLQSIDILGHFSLSMHIYAFLLRFPQLIFSLVSVEPLQQNRSLEYMTVLKFLI